MIFILLASHLLAFGLGVLAIGPIAYRQMVENLLMFQEQTNAYEYRAMRDISRALRDEDVAKAICLSEMAASSYFDDLKACVNDERCAKRLDRPFLNLIPEVHGDGSLGFEYVKPGFRVCRL
ncbi:MAG: hypothetical protein KIT73_08210 [Burkholderiales bacterium]|nr:hypothetical protein [Burkholderiales bacterium]